MIPGNLAHPNSSFLCIIFFFLNTNTWGKFAFTLPRGCKARALSKTRTWETQHFAACRNGNLLVSLPRSHRSEAFITEHPGVFCFVLGFFFWFGVF